MIKTMTALSLQDGTDPEEFWRYHIGIHAEEVRAFTSARRYVISRVDDVVYGVVDFFDMVELWWDSREALGARRASPSAAHAVEDFRRRGGLYTYRTVVEERMVIPERPILEEDGGGKLVVAYHLAAGANGDAVWRDLTGAYAGAVIEAAGGNLRKFHLNRRVETLLGEPGFLAIGQLRWAGPAGDGEQLAQLCADTSLPHGGTVAYVAVTRESEILLK